MTEKGEPRMAGLAKTPRWLWIVALLSVALLIAMPFGGGPDRTEIPYSEFGVQVDRENVAWVEIDPGQRQVRGAFRAPVAIANEQVTSFVTYLPFDDATALVERLGA